MQTACARGGLMWRYVGAYSRVMPTRSSKPKRRKNSAAVALGRLGGSKGGKARAKNLSPARRTEIAKKAAIARWGEKPLPDAQERAEKALEMLKRLR